MRPEDRFRDDLVPELRKLGAYVIPIETGATQRGVPDLYVSKFVRISKHLWCELKIVSPYQKKDPRRPKQILRQKEMQEVKIRILNAHDVRDSKDRQCGYRTEDIMGKGEFLDIYSLAAYIVGILEN